MSDEIEYTCDVCGKPVPGYKPRYCCSGHECGCQGREIDPCVCSDECYSKLLSDIGGPTKYPVCPHCHTEDKLNPIINGSNVCGYCHKQYWVVSYLRYETHKNKPTKEPK